MVMLNVSGLPYMELGGRLMVGSEGGTLVCGWFVSIGCFCMVAAEIIEDGDVKVGCFLDFLKEKVRSLVSVDL